MGRTDKGKTAKYKYDTDYIKKNTRAFCIRFNYKTDKDILKHIEKENNFVGYVKELIRKDIENKSN